MKLAVRLQMQFGLFFKKNPPFSSLYFNILCKDFYKDVSRRQGGFLFSEFVYVYLEVTEKIRCNIT